MNHPQSWGSLIHLIFSMLCPDHMIVLTASGMGDMQIQPQIHILFAGTDWGIRLQTRLSFIVLGPKKHK